MVGILYYDSCDAYKISYNIVTYDRGRPPESVHTAAKQVPAWTCSILKLSKFSPTEDTMKTP